MANATTTSGNSASVTLKDQAPSDFKPVFADILDKSENLDRRSDKGIVNNKTGSSMAIRDDGQINLSASPTAQFKVNPNGKTEEIALESITKTNRKSYEVDDFVINNHKLNPQLWELADFRQLFGDTKYAIGGLTTMGTVLVKAWEPNLKRYVMIRRLCRVPIFSQEMNTAKIHDGLNVSDSTVVANTYDVASSKSTEANSTTADSGLKAVNTAITANNATSTSAASTAVKAVAPSAASGDTTTTATTEATQTPATSTDVLASVKTAAETAIETSKASTASATSSEVLTSAKAAAKTSIVNKINTAATDALASIKTATTVANTNKVDSATVEQATTLSETSNNLTKQFASDSKNAVVNDISAESTLLSKDLSLGLTAVDKQLTQIKTDLVAQTLKDNAGKTAEEKKSAAQLILSAADNAFVSNKLSILKSAASVQTQSESFINSKVTELKKTNADLSKVSTKTIYASVYSQVKSSLAGDTTAIATGLSSKNLTNVVLGKTALSSITSGIQKTILSNTEGIIKKSILTNIMSDINKEKAVLTSLQTQAKRFEQAEIAKVQALIQAEVNKVISAATAEATKIVTSAVKKITSSL